MITGIFHTFAGPYINVLMTSDEYIEHNEKTAGRACIYIYVMYYLFFMANVLFDYPKDIFSKVILEKPYRVAISN